MGNSVLRNYIKETIREAFSNMWLYSSGPNKFPYMDGTDAKIPSDLASEAEAEAEFGKSEDEIGESEDIEEINTSNNNKH